MEMDNDLPEASRMYQSYKKIKDSLSLDLPAKIPLTLIIGQREKSTAWGQTMHLSNLQDLARVSGWRQQEKGLKVPPDMRCLFERQSSFKRILNRRCTTREYGRAIHTSVICPSIHEGFVVAFCLLVVYQL